MKYADESMMLEEAKKTKQKRDDIIKRDKPFSCKKCGKEKFPHEFVIHFEENMAGKYQYLYECKDCKKRRIYIKRGENRNTIQGAVRMIYNQLQQNAKQRNIEFELTEEDILHMREKQNGTCYYSGYEMQYEFIHYKGGNFSTKTKYQISCDRLNSAIGYTQKNTVLCCTLINKMKGILSEQEFYEICKDILDHQKNL